MLRENLALLFIGCAIAAGCWLPSGRRARLHRRPGGHHRLRGCRRDDGPGPDALMATPLVAPDVVGIAEVARLANVSKTTVTVGLARHDAAAPALDTPRRWPRLAPRAHPDLAGPSARTTVTHLSYTPSTTPRASGGLAP